MKLTSCFFVLALRSAAARQQQGTAPLHGFGLARCGLANCHACPAMCAELERPLRRSGVVLTSVFAGGTRTLRCVCLCHCSECVQIRWIVLGNDIILGAFAAMTNFLLLVTGDIRTCWRRRRLRRRRRRGRGAMRANSSPHLQRQWRPSVCHVPVTNRRHHLGHRFGGSALRHPCGGLLHFCNGRLPRFLLSAWKAISLIQWNRIAQQWCNNSSEWENNI